MFFEESFVSYCTLAISIISCLLSIYNFLELRSRRIFENKCLIESRFLIIKTKNDEIQSIIFRFCLTNISEKAVALRKIYFRFPALNKGKKILIDQIGETQFNFAKENEFKSKYRERVSFKAKGSQEVLPYILKPNTKYEGHAMVGINDNVIECSSPIGKNPPENMVVILEFDRAQKFVVPITYKEMHPLAEKEVCPN